MESQLISFVRRLSRAGYVDHFLPRGKGRSRAALAAAICLVASGCDTTLPEGVNVSNYTVPPAQAVPVEFKNANHTLQFEPRSGTISKGERHRLEAFVSDFAGNRPESLRVELSAGSEAHLRRVANILIGVGVEPKSIILAPRSARGAPAGMILVRAQRALAVLPDCPGWVDHVSAPEDNRGHPNFGCSNINNVAAMLGDPHDLIHGRSSIYEDGERAAVAVQAYRTDKVKELPPLQENFSVIPSAR
jgi:pilus assembly protein CpaD